FFYRLGPLCLPANRCHCIQPLFHCRSCQLWPLRDLSSQTCIPFYPLSLFHSMYQGRKGCHMLRSRLCKCRRPHFCSKPCFRLPCYILLCRRCRKTGICSC